MRRPERIQIILAVLKDDANKKKVLEHFFKPEEGAQIKLHEPIHDVDFHVKLWSENFGAFEDIWTHYPDLRLTQVLVNSGILPNYPGSWYYIEDNNVMVDCKFLEPRDIYFWGKNYDKDMKRLPETEWILIKDMSIDHIKAILDSDNIIAPHYIEFFRNELTLRKK